MSRKNEAPDTVTENPERGPEPFDPARAAAQPDPIVVYGPDGTILYVNPAMVAAMGFAAREMIGKPLLSYVPEDSRDGIRPGLMDRDGSNRAQLSEIAFCANGGLVRSMIVKGKPIHYDNAPATLLFLIDITGRKVLEDQLAARAEELQRISAAYQKANRKLALLSSITRHDIGNQLTVVKGYLGMVVPLETDPTLAEYCTKAAAAAERIDAMIRFTSEYDKIGISDPSWQDIRSTIETAAAQAPLGQVVVRNGIPEGREVFSDPLIVKVFYNLMDNAVRYGETITTIRFSMGERDGGVMITCEDDGVGVAADEKEKIFERGFGKHTGLGLALSREILDITGIAIRESGPPGAGARFEIVVPGASFRWAGGAP
jgi:PAS domain S-box-containing protein